MCVRKHVKPCDEWTLDYWTQCTQASKAMRRLWFVIAPETVRWYLSKRQLFQCTMRCR